MFSKIKFTLCVLLLTVADIQPTEAKKHRYHREPRLSQLVQDTRTPPCVTCSSCHSPKEGVCSVARTHHRQFTARASWYGGRWHGRRTASGERFNQYAMTTAHKTLPFGTRVRITNHDNNRSVIVTVNDRGPYVRGREFDLSKGAANAISMNGVARVTAEILG